MATPENIKGPSVWQKFRNVVVPWNLWLFWLALQGMSSKFRSALKEVDLGDTSRSPIDCLKVLDKPQWVLANMVLDMACLDFEDTADVAKATWPHLKKLQFRAALDAAIEELD